MLHRRSSYQSGYQPVSSGYHADDRDNHRADHRDDYRAVSVIPAPPAVKRCVRVAAYCRVSTTLESQETSIEHQAQYYQNLVENTEGWELAGIYREQGVSATGSDARPVLEQLLANCRAGKVDLVIAKSISRFSRNLEHLLEMVRFLSSLNVRIILEKEHIDTGKADPQLLLSLLGAFAELESQSISHNVAWGIRRRFQDGTYKVSHLPYGYRYEGADIIPDNTEAAVVQQIFKLALTGLGADLIAQQLNHAHICVRSGGAWNPGNIRYILHNPYYTGTLLTQKRYLNEAGRRVKNNGQLEQYIHENHHPAIISREDSEKVSTLMEMHCKAYNINDENTKKRANRYCFSGKIICAACARPMHRERGSYYRCFSRRKGACTMPNAYEEDLQNAFATMLNKLSFAQEKLRIFDQLLAQAGGGRNIPPVGSDQKDQKDQKNQEDQEELTKLYQQMQAGRVDTVLLTRKRVLETAFTEYAQEDRRSISCSENAEAIAELRSIVRERGIQGSFTDADEDIFMRIVKKMVVDTGKEAVFHLRCGLVFAESLMV